MLLERIEKNLKKIESNIDKDNFIYQFLEAYEQPKSAIKRLKDGDYNLSKKQNEVIWKKKIHFYKVSDDEDVHVCIDKLSKSEYVIKNKIRFIIVTDFQELLSIDKKNNLTLDIKISELSNNSEFFLPLAGLEKTENIKENEADVKAAYKMGKLYDLIIKNNKNILENSKDKHSLNIFFSRIVFCFFAEDSGIFEKSLFTNSISSHTLEDGSDISDYLSKLFIILNTEKRDDRPKYLKNFPYVNGGLFKNNYKIPNLSKEFRKELIECGDLNWEKINPDIFGSMLQAIVDKGERSEIGMHYTSVSNILKVIKPLFLDDLYDSFKEAGEDKKKLEKILKRIYNFIIFDPACGSGNFLVIAYKELYKLEIDILCKLQDLDKNFSLILGSGISLTQFFGIEQDDYAHEAAKISLWITQHQMNNIFKDQVNIPRDTLPLSPSGNIFCANSLKIDWENFCRKEKNKEIYLVGNPPYLGSSMQSKKQKEEMAVIFKNRIKSYKNLDYISCWFIKASEYIKNSAIEVAFVTTNSITQGEQVGILWPYIFSLNVEIGFAYKSFSWSNHAKGKAGVTCVILNLRSISNKKKFIIENFSKKTVKDLSPYLLDIDRNIIIHRTTKPINGFPTIFKGNMATDGGNFLLDIDEKNKLLNSHPKASKFIKKYVGTEDFFYGIQRWCLWITDEEKEEALKIKEINDKVQKVKNFRLSSKAPTTKLAADISHKFIWIAHEPENCMLVPAVSSQNRDYVPYGFFNKDYVISANSNVIYKPEMYIFSVLSSKMHMIWFKTVAGRLRTDFRYSTNLCYNPFPFPKINISIRKKLEALAFEAIDEREKFSDLSIADMYNRSKMPKSLLKKHIEIDEAIDSVFDVSTSMDENRRIELLFRLYDDNNKNYRLI